MNIELTADEIHALIEWHDESARICNQWDADHVVEAGAHKQRADELWFLITGSRRKAAAVTAPGTSP